jgi:hypothetical protein
MAKTSHDYMNIEHNILGDYVDHNHCTTLCRNGNCEINFIIDRDPTYINAILNYMRTGHVYMEDNMSIDGLREEARFYHILPMVSELDQMIR